MATRDRILDLAQEHAQKAGFRGFSYKDIADTLGVKTAAIHYHFPKKENLGEALSKRYIDDLKALLGKAARSDGATRLDRFTALFRETLQAGKLCLCASIATDKQVVPPPMSMNAQAFFIFAEKWLYEAIKAGTADGSLSINRDPLVLATEFRALVYGAMLTAQNSGQIGDFDGVITAWRAVNTPAG